MKNIGATNTILILLTVVFLAFFVKKDSGEREYKNKIFLALFVLATIGLISQAFLFILLLPAMWLIVVNASTKKGFKIESPSFKSE